ncbi:MAG: hypothetical protein A3H29_10460 [Acidobacteria bacterium RIFCSPLOWO2_02_FULL_67_21]|nr:MAG: hypothetical protein A3H29_10460 [Acidobacteria bacterium RIFCSPLOWO2_02_FULL_67_21]
MTIPDAAAVIVNFNAGTDLRDALQSIADEFAGLDWEAVVIDNASTDDSPAIVTEFEPRARLVRNGANLGFARGVNQGLAHTAAPLVLIMNPDCRLRPGAFAALRRALEGTDRCAVAGPRILDPDGAVQGSARGDPDMLTGVFGRTTLLRRLLPRLAVSRRNVIGDADAGEGASLTVDWVSGACMLVRRDAVESVAGLDERYFLYWEDADLCRRLRARGYLIRYVPAASAIHGVGRSSRTAKAASIRAFHDSAYLYYATHVAPRSWPKRALARALLAARCRLRLFRAERASWS